MLCQINAARFFFKSTIYVRTHAHAAFVFLGKSYIRTLFLSSLAEHVGLQRRRDVHLRGAGRCRSHGCSDECRKQPLPVPVEPATKRNEFRVQVLAREYERQHHRGESSQASYSGAA